MIRGEGVAVVLGEGEGCVDGGEGGDVEEEEDGGVVISGTRGVVVIPLPLSSRGSLISALHNERVQHLLICKQLKKAHHHLATLASPYLN